LGEGTYVCGRSEFFSRPLLWAITGSTQAEAHELVEARKLIEVELAGFAAQRATPEDLKTIGVHMDEMERTVDQPAAFLEADLNFHLAISQAGHNRILLNALHLIRNLLRQWIGRTLRMQGVAQQALEQHRSIFMAVAKRNPESARAAMQAHLEAMARLLIEEQANREPGDDDDRAGF
jgi:GntR family transcriptional repressor for pyruvate dehydrogenase complex